MKKIHLILLAAVIMLAFSSCKREEPIVYTTLSELAAKSTTAYQDFDIHIQGLTVSGTYQNYVQMEDQTAGAQFSSSGNTFKAGQLIEGHITGKARISSGALLLSDLDVSGATVTATQNIPCTTLKLSDLVADNVKYSHRRVKLVNMTFVNGFNGTAGGAGIISQKGVQMSATCRPAGFKVEDGAQGDLICYPTGAACYVFDANDFVEHEITTPLTEKKDFGVYTVTETSASDVSKYTPGIDQYGYSAGEKNTDFRYQNYQSGWVVALNYPSKVKAGQVVDMNVDYFGNVSGVTAGKTSVVVEKVGTDKLWLMDYVAGTGYVVYYEKEEK